MKKQIMAPILPVWLTIINPNNNYLNQEEILWENLNLSKHQSREFIS